MAASIAENMTISSIDSFSAWLSWCKRSFYGSNWVCFEASGLARRTPLNDSGHWLRVLFLEYYFTLVGLNDQSPIYFNKLTTCNNVGFI
jgi:hypothetical protein